MNDDDKIKTNDNGEGSTGSSGTDGTYKESTEEFIRNEQEKINVRGAPPTKIIQTKKPYIGAYVNKEPSKGRDK